MKDALISVKPEDLKQSHYEARSARISSVYREHRHPPAVKDYVGDAKSLREYVLRLSLFPNLANRNTVRMSD